MVASKVAFGIVSYRFILELDLGRIKGVEDRVAHLSSLVSTQSVRKGSFAHMTVDHLPLAIACVSGPGATA